MTKPKESTERAQGIILWLTGWSMPSAVFGRLQAMLQDYDHISADYSKAESPEEIAALAETAVFAAQSVSSGRPVLIAGWSLGGLLALRLAAGVDGLILLASTARFTRSKDQMDPGWPDDIRDNERCIAEGSAGGGI